MAPNVLRRLTDNRGDTAGNTAVPMRVIEAEARPIKQHCVIIEGDVQIKKECSLTVKLYRSSV